MLGLELNDAGLILAQDDDGTPVIVAEEPGYALLDENRLLTGADAERRARLKPLLAQNRYWRDLGVEPLSRPLGGARSAADLAFAQLDHLLAGAQKGMPLLIAVPAGYSRDQLGLLLGIAQETGAEVRGLVDAALAACSLEPAPSRVLHLDLELHRAMLAVLEQGSDESSGLRRARFELLPGHGWLDLTQTWLHLIAETFVRRSRFDPLHQAATEQRLAQLIPPLLSDAAPADTLPIELEFGATTHRIEIERSEFVRAAERHYEALVKLVQDVRPAGHAVELRVGERAARLPGLIERFEALRDARVTRLPRGAAAIGALRHAPHIERPANAVALVYRLPIAGRATPLVEFGATMRAETPAERRPTHVLFGSRAWRIAREPLTLGWSVPSGRRALILPQGAAGVSRAHCTVSARDGNVIVEDHSTFGSWVNDERVSGEATLEVGDRLRLGAPGVVMELIRTVDDDGPSQG
jgi:hypothetical protein